MSHVRSKPTRKTLDTTEAFGHTLEYLTSESELPPTQSYRPGSLIQLTLTNFMIHKLLVIKPGPGLNLIVGPNGAGMKSKRIK